ncbi:hypothetical protein CF326_g9500 [Tilletia indica]|nr:hypothetical protein CF326_g9500 [Tilletia indica]
MSFFHFLQDRDSGCGAKTRHLPDNFEVRDTGTGTARLKADGPGLTGKVRKTTANGGALSRCFKTRTRIGSVDDDRLRGPGETRWVRVDITDLSFLLLQALMGQGASTTWYH